MFFDDTTYDLIARAGILTTVGILYVILLTRIVGLRSFSKMTNFDFVMTIALGSLLATAAGADSWQVFGQSLAAQAALFFVQWGTAKLRRSSDTIETVMQNAPVFLMRDGQFCEDALDTTRVAKSDVIAKLREANALDLDKVHAVVLETTGDVSVLHGDRLDERLIENVTAQ